MLISSMMRLSLQSETVKPTRITHIDQNLRQQAGECGYRSMLVALGVAEDSSQSCEVLSYEAPWGVGYLVAQLTSVTPEASKK
jgi:aromatic ring-opening dioxygenase LigB subunit